MKKIGKLLLYLFLIVGSLLVIYRHAVQSFISRLASSQQGILIQCFNAGYKYFKDADAFNLIFLVMFCCVALLAFVGIDYMSKRLFLKLKEKGLFKARIFQIRWILTVAHKWLGLIIICGVFIVACNLIVVFFGLYHSVESADELQGEHPVLVLGTSKLLSSGKGINLYYQHRIDAAVQLWNGGKVTFFIISGDRSSDSYDETRDISLDLMAAGVPESRIKLDTAGFRTLDSMLRIREIFKTRELVIVTQSFHLQRALFLAHFFAINATGLEAAGKSTRGMAIREFFSKPKVILDLVFFNMQPKVKVAGKDRIEFREEFTVNSDLHVALLLTLILAVLSTLGLVFKYID